ncbi:MAG: alpha/beta fold hydrolase [Thiovulaceae bacterium]|nr:alpha/beta fold hydrolase [Sulfurimonadaceae bacterium]
MDERYTPLEIQAEDGTTLEGMEFTPEHFSHTIFYLGGRSQDSVALIHRLAFALENNRIVTFNYRGYGNSQGTPSEQNVYEDAAYIAEKLKERYGNFSIVGFSLGSSVAAYVASKIKVEKLFLLGGFDSVFHIIKNKIPLLPSFLIRYKFDTALHVSSVEAPTYLVSSKDDNIVPIKNANNLKISIKNLTEFKELSSYNHDEILFSQESVNLIKKGLN